MNRLFTRYFSLFLRDGVVSRTAPRVARCHAFYRQPAAFDGTVFPYRLDAVVGTCRGVAAIAADEGRKRVLIYLYQQNQEVRRQFDDESHNFFHNFSAKRSTTFFIFSAISSYFRMTVALYTNATSSVLLFSWHNFISSALFFLQLSRIRRFTRLRFTA